LAIKLLCQMKTYKGLIRNLRSFRALAIKLVLQWQAEGEAAHRATMPALLLTAGSAWMLNGLHSAPDKGASSKELMAAILPHVARAGADRDILAYGTPTKDDDIDSEASTQSDENLPPPTRARRDATTLPAFPYGLVFLRNIRVGPQHPVPRLNNEGLSIRDKAFRYFFKVNPDQVQEEFFRAALVQPAHPNRISNKVRRTATYYLVEGNEAVPDFDLAGRGYRLPSPVQDTGSDMEVDMDQGDGNEGDGIDEELTKIWRQFLLDITQKAPNKKSAADPSYCVLSDNQRREVTERTYQNRKLSDYFLDCQWKIASSSEWSLVFNRLFPPKNGRRLAGKVQNYESAQYYANWAKLKDRADDETASRMQEALRKKFDSLYWMPFAQTDRIWKTKVEPKFNKSSGVDREVAAPQVFVRDQAPLW
jgi:hypothetical protein